MKYKIYQSGKMAVLGALLAVASVGFAESSQPPAEPPVVVATIKPLHSIAASVTDGVSEARLLLDGGTSPHVFQLKPSHIRSISDADVVLWAGVGVERFVPKMLQSFAPEAKAIELATLPDAVTFAARNPNRDGEHRKADLRKTIVGKTTIDKADDHEIDYHLWLHPANAGLLANALADQLAQIDPTHAMTYRANAQALAAELKTTTTLIEKMLSNAKARKYLIYHDSLQYFEKAFGLGDAIVVTSQPQVQAGGKRIRQLQKDVRANNVTCILAEEQFRSPILDVLATDMNLQTVKIDPLASGMDSGPDLYTNWLQQIAATIAECVQ